MFWNSGCSAAGAIHRWFQVILVCFTMAAASGVQAQEQHTAMDVWLVTYGPGEISWQRFGHNAIWIRDEASGLDHAFNFGFFDFEQEAFYRRFLQGKLWYFSAAQPAEREFSQYINENRSIRAQRLDLSEDQSLMLAEYLLGEIRPEKRDYLYDYYTNNCSTRIRDALDLALDGELSRIFSDQPAHQNWRDHTRRLTADDFWLYLGLEIGLGSMVDRENSRWEEFFIPSELAAAIKDFQISGPAGDRPLVTEDIMLYESSLEPPPARTANWWPRYLLLSALVLVAAWLICRWVPGVSASGLVRGWLALSGLAGCILVFFWFFTDHQAARNNLNLLLLNPLGLFFALWNRPRLAGWLLIILSVVAAITALVPGGQYNLDVAAAVLPINVAAALVLLRMSRD